ncbi:sex hormone-binding globulin-like, partial [Rhinophrynus dorsalis]
MPRLPADILLGNDLGHLQSRFAPMGAHEDCQVLTRAATQCRMMLSRPLEFLDPEHSIHLNQNLDRGLPAGSVDINLSNVTSASSIFEVRTFDPEGVLFFGDSTGGRDWFLLGLRGGRPEIQIHNQIAKVSVSGGPRLNDGEWHKVEIRNEEHRIVLEVDGEESLRIGHVTEAVTPSLDTVMRIAVGGILNNHTELMEPMQIPLDGCLRRWVFLGVSPKWFKDPNSLHSPKLCFSSHRRGSYFNGAGTVEYRTRDLIPATLSLDQPWTLSIQMNLHPETNVFTLLSVSQPEIGPILTLKGTAETLVIEVGNITSLILPLPKPTSIGGSRLLLEVTHTNITLQYGDIKDCRDLSEEGYGLLTSAWHDDGILYIGGGP